jgi:glycosyltransferase involved in cell wall biosynthesis
VPRAPGEPLRVNFLGSLVWYKGLDVLARAVAALPAGAAHLHVHGDHLGGADPVAAAECRAVAAQARDLAGDRLSFHGRYDHDRLAEVHARLDVLVVPSVWRRRPHVREAFLSRTPVIGSDIAGIAEGIRNEVNGLLFETGNPDALAAQLRRLIDDPGLGPRLAAAAPAVKTDLQEAEEMEWRYRQVLSERGKIRA